MIMKLKRYNIYIHSNEHPRTINSFANSRCWYTKISVYGRDALVSKVAELRENGEKILQISTDLGTRIYI